MREILTTFPTLVPRQPDRRRRSVHDPAHPSPNLQAGRRGGHSARCPNPAACPQDIHRNRARNGAPWILVSANAARTSKHAAVGAASGNVAAPLAHHPGRRRRTGESPTSVPKRIPGRSVMNLMVRDSPRKPDSMHMRARYSPDPGRFRAQIARYPAPRRMRPPLPPDSGAPASSHHGRRRRPPGAPVRRQPPSGIMQKDHQDARSGATN